MSTLVTLPRRLTDLVDWFDEGFRYGDGHVIRVEDRLTDKDYEVRAELPGVDPDKDVAVTVDRGVLTIHAERHDEHKEKGRTEFHYGMFDRSMRLPANADPEHITAGYDKGILKITVPLTAPVPTGRKIAIGNGKPAAKK
jgi:HSP20 family molecular chaperone IbpA